MIDQDKRKAKQQAKDRIRRRMRAEIDPENYEYIPAKRPADFYDTEVQQRVAVYVRVSTDDIRQTTSYELQQKYYEELEAPSKAIYIFENSAHSPIYEEYDTAKRVLEKTKEIKASTEEIVGQKNHEGTV